MALGVKDPVELGLVVGVDVLDPDGVGVEDTLRDELKDGVQLGDDDRVVVLDAVRVVVTDVVGDGVRDPVLVGVGVGVGVGETHSRSAVALQAAKYVVQLEQLVQLAEPLIALNRPAAHAVHTVEEVEDVIVLYVPAGQPTHVSAPLTLEKVPAGHTGHVAAPAALQRPAAHAVHTRLVVDLENVLYAPDPQLEHALAAGALE